MSNTFKTTAGPWSISYDKESLPIIDSPTGVIALVRTGENDARAIAAIPRLLSELEATLPVVDDAETEARAKSRDASDDRLAEDWGRVADSFKLQVDSIRSLIKEING